MVKHSAYIMYDEEYLYGRYPYTLDVRMRERERERERMSEKNTVTERASGVGVMCGVG